MGRTGAASCWVAGRFELRGERFNRGILIEIDHREVAKFGIATEFGDHSGGEQRVAAQIVEEVVGERHGQRGEQPLPGDGELSFRSLRPTSSAEGARLPRRGKTTTIHLAAEQSRER